MKLRLFLLAIASLAVTGCSNENPRVTTRLNHDAMVTGDLPANPMQGKVITSWVNQQDATMSTLFGNDVAVQYARTNAEAKYPAGSVLSVVTWSQQEDARWFGGKIPAKPKAVEVVTVGAAEGAASYQRYEGSPLKKVTNDAAVGNDRIAYLLSQRASVMP